jgi:hypothetical protein
MKNLLILLLLPMLTHAQRVARVYNHETTGEKVYESTVESWIKGGANASATFQLRRIGNVYDMEVKFLPLVTGAGTLYTVQPKDSLIIITTKGSRVGLPPVKATNSCVGCGMFDSFGEYVHGSTTHHTIGVEALDVLLHEDVAFIGLQSDFGYVQQEVRSRNSQSLRILLGYMVTY